MEQSKKELFSKLQKAGKLFGNKIPIRPVKVDLRRDPEEIIQIIVIGDAFYNSDTLHNISNIWKSEDMKNLTRRVNDAIVKKLREETSLYAIEHITGKGMHTGIAWLRDSFNELCEAMGVTMEFNNVLLQWDGDFPEFLRKEPWVVEMAKKPAYELNDEDFSRIKKNFLCKYWDVALEDLSNKDAIQILRLSDPVSHRQIVAQRVAIDCVHALDQQQLQRLDDVLREIALQINNDRSIHR